MAILLDTSGLLAILNVRDPRHGTAVTLFGAAGNKVVHSHVLAELVALATVRGVARSRILGFIRSLLTHPEVESVWADAELVLRSLQLLESRLDKDWSLCDAISFILMQQRGIREALTTDHHFEQAGFVRLL